ncbi:unnamed protein product [Peniophora sp. CBMAI 1063]|nr:unnamed protein product [Peniophora sp. CBMAI 1063]
MGLHATAWAIVHSGGESSARTKTTLEARLPRFDNFQDPHMIDWTSSSTLYSQTASLQKVTLSFAGIYFYEFASSLPHDWEVVKKLRGKPTTLIGNALYLLCRYLIFMTCVCSCLLASGYREFSCQALLKTHNTSAGFGIACASGLLFVRACIIWKWNRWVIAFLSPFLAAVCGCTIQITVLFTSSFDPKIGQCTLTSAIIDRSLCVALFSGDITLLAFIFIGLQRGWQGARGFPLWFTLWNQGLLYFALAVMVEAPLVASSFLIFLMLDLNEIMNAMFVVPAVVMMATGATRFHRTLSGYSNRPVLPYKISAHSAEPNSYELANIVDRRARGASVNPERH